MQILTIIHLKLTLAPTFRELLQSNIEFIFEKNQGYYFDRKGQKPLRLTLC
jgi:hypothetical protein